MHRSGTSALAGLLHNNNIVMGEERNFIPKASQENIKGFYENYLFRRINDRIVEKCGYIIKSWNINIPQIRASFLSKHRMRAILRRYNRKYDKWGWKDPRTCLTLGLWLREIEKLDLIYSCKLIFIMRDPHSVAHSMNKRGNTSFENALKLWLKYNEYAMKSIEARFHDRAHYLTYEDLCNNPMKTSRSIFEFIEHPLDESVVSKFIDPQLNRSTIIEDNYNYNISKELTEKLRDFKEKFVKRTI